MCVLEGPSRIELLSPGSKPDGLNRYPMGPEPPTRIELATGDLQSPGATMRGGKTCGGLCRIRTHSGDADNVPCYHYTNKPGVRVCVCVCVCWGGCQESNLEQTHPRRRCCHYTTAPMCVCVCVCVFCCVVKLLGIEPRSLGWKPSVLPLYYSSLWRPWQESNLLHAVLEAAALPLSYKAVCVCGAPSQNRTGHPSFGGSGRNHAWWRTYCTTRQSRTACPDVSDRGRDHTW